MIALFAVAATSYDVEVAKIEAEAMDFRLVVCLATFLTCFIIGCAIYVWSWRGEK